jgi:hypothetical protein
MIDLLEHEAGHHGQLIRYLYGLRREIPESWKKKYALGRVSKLIEQLLENQNVSSTHFTILHYMLPLDRSVLWIEILFAKAFQVAKLCGHANLFCLICSWVHCGE